MKLDKIEIPVKFHVSITTSINGSNIECVVKTSSGGSSGDSSGVLKHIMDTSEEETKKALIILGWTPPKEKE